MIDYNHSPFDTKKGVHVLVMLEYNIRPKTKQNNAVSGSHPICGPICGSVACTGPVPERGGGGPMTG